MANLQDFNPWQTFKFLTSDDSLGYLSASALTTYIRQNGLLNASRSEVENFLIFTRQKSPAQLDYQEFLELVLPNRRLKARQRALKRANNDDKSSEASAVRISQKVNFAISQVLDHELRLFREID